MVCAFVLTTEDLSQPSYRHSIDSPYMCLYMFLNCCFSVDFSFSGSDFWLKILSSTLSLCLVLSYSSPFVAGAFQMNPCCISASLLQNIISNAPEDECGHVSLLTVTATDINLCQCDQPP